MNDILEQFRREYRNYPATSLENQFADEFERMRREVEELKENDEIIREDYQRLLANAKRMGDELAELRKASSAPTIPEGWQRVIEAAKWAIFCPDAGGYKDGRSVEDCYEELEAAVNAYFGTDIQAADIDYITEDELNSLLAAATKHKEVADVAGIGDTAADN